MLVKINSKCDRRAKIKGGLERNDSEIIEVESEKKEKEPFRVKIWLK